MSLRKVTFFVSVATGQEEDARIDIEQCGIPHFFQQSKTLQGHVIFSLPYSCFTTAPDVVVALLR